MPPRDDRIILTEREWQAQQRLNEHFAETLERLEREQLVFKAKASVWMFIIGAIASALVSAGLHFLP